MRLSNLPRDVLAIVLNGPNSFLAIELWKTGDRILQQTLANGGVTEMRLSEGRQGWVQSKWPRCIKRFKLRSLCVVAPMMTISSPWYSTKSASSLLRLELQQIHSGVKILELRWPSVYRDIFQLDSSTLPPKGADPATAVSTDSYYYAYGRMRPMDDCFQSLESLTLVGREMPHWVYPWLLGSLPRGLTSLHLHANKYPLAIRDLPQHLRSLTLPAQTSLTFDELALLPASITELGRFLDQSTITLLAASPHLLPNLCHFPSAPHWDEGSTMSKAPYWPPNIQTLTLQGHNIRAEVLPSLLTDLECELPLEPSLRYLNQLPPLLTRLTAGELPWNDLGTIFRSTPLLRSLTVRRSPSSIISLCALPRSLEELHLFCTTREAVEGHETDDNFDIEILSVGISSLDSERELWQFLKTKLLLAASSKKGPSPLQVAEYIAEVEKGRLFGLPLGLKSFTTSFKGDTPRCRRLMPPQVTKVDLVTSDGLHQAGFWKLLPPSITDLKVRTSAPKLACWSSLTTKNVSDSAIFNMKNVTSFSWLFLTTELAEAIILYLPKNLQTLSITIQHDKRLNVKSLRKLPSKLQTLSLHCNVSSKNAWLGSLPRSITHLTIQSMELHGPDLVNLPPNLDFLSTSFAGNVSRAHLLALPRTLRKIDAINHYEAHLRVISVVYPFWRIWELSEEEIDDLVTFDQERPRRLGYH